MKDDYPEQDAGRWERYAGGTARKRVTGKDGEAIYQFRTTVPRIPVGDARKAAVAAVAPRRQQTLDDLEFSLGSKQTMQDALNELSADEISDMFRAMDKGPGVDVRTGRNKMAHDTMRMKRGVEADETVDETGALTSRRRAAIDAFEAQRRVAEVHMKQRGHVLPATLRELQKTAAALGSPWYTAFDIAEGPSKRAREEEEVGTLW